MQKVFLVEDSEPVLDRLISMLGTLPNTQIVGHATGAEEAARAILAVRPDLVVLDLRLAQGTGFDVLLELHDKAAGIDVYVVSGFSYPQYRQQAQRFGALAFFDKGTEMERLRDAIAKRGAQPAA